MGNWFKNIKMSDTPLPEHSVHEDIKEETGRLDRREFPINPPKGRTGTGYTHVKRDMTEDTAQKMEQKYKDLELMDYGSCGVVFREKNKDNIRIKFTPDSSEYISALELMKEQRYEGRVHGFVKIFCAKEHENGIYEIVTERVAKLEKKEAEIVDILYHSESLIYDGNNDVFMFKSFRRSYPELADTPLFKKVYRRYKEMILNIKDAGADSGDAWSENIGKMPDGEYVILDLGGLYG